MSQLYMLVFVREMLELSLKSRLFIISKGGGS